MKKLYFALFLVIIGTKLFSQSTDAQIRHSFKDSHSATAQILDVMDAAFLSKTKKLTQGAYYIVQPCINGHVQNGDFITIYSPDMENYINAKTDTLYRWLIPNIPIVALLKYTGNVWRPFDVIEIVKP